jgi:hypothetical protein
LCLAKQVLLGPLLGLLLLEQGVPCRRNSRRSSWLGTDAAVHSDLNSVGLNCFFKICFLSKSLASSSLLLFYYTNKFIQALFWLWLNHKKTTHFLIRVLFHNLSANAEWILYLRVCFITYIIQFACHA